MIKWKMLFRFLLLLAIWFVFSGVVDWQHFVAGVGAVLLVMLFWHQKQRDEDSGLGWSALCYGPVLVVAMLAEIWRSAWHVALIILLRRPVEPRFVWLETDLRSRLGRVVLANCITLTPGTLTVSLDGDRLQVHALTPEHAAGLDNWRIHNLLRRMEGVK